jgi:hypothetical protein
MGDVMTRSIKLDTDKLLGYAEKDRVGDVPLSDRRVTKLAGGKVGGEQMQAPPSDRIGQAARSK